MTNASLARKLARMAGGRQARAREAASRGPINLGLGMLAAAEDLDPRDLLAEEQDRRRENLAERLLEICAEETVPSDGEDWSTHLCNIARGALAAATVLYPEVPAEVELSDVPAEPLVPPQAFEGAQSVAPEGSEP